MRGAGRSAIRSAASPVLVAFGIGVLALLILNPIVAATAREYQMTVARYQGAEQRTVSVSAEGLWLRQGTLSEQTVIHAEGTNSDGTHLFDANFFTFDARGLLTDGSARDEALLVRRRVGACGASRSGPSRASRTPRRRRCSTTGSSCPRR
jgi:lipopolysaccharide export system permease protein